MPPPEIKERTKRGKELGQEDELPDEQGHTQRRRYGLEAEQLRAATETLNSGEEKQLYKRKIGVDLS